VRTGSAATRSIWLLLALVAALPFVRPALGGESLFFRDLARHFLPLRLFALEGVRRGELRYWNPLVHEGIPAPFPPLSGPLELLQVLWPSEAGVSFFLFLHVPLAALAFAWLWRSTGGGRTGAFTGGLAYALGGFSLSMINLYVYVQAVAWAPLLIGGLLRASSGDRRRVALAALAVAGALCTMGAEIVAQALLAAFVLVLVRSSPTTRRTTAVATLAALALGVVLAAPTLVALAGVAARSPRAEGFPTAVVLAHSIHPLTWLQVVIGDFYGDLGRLTDRFWGSNYFPRGFPYVLSLYLGATVVGLAVMGAAQKTEERAGLLALLAGAVFVALGRWGGLEPVVDAIPALHAFRFPTKAFYTVHLVIALLAARGADAVRRQPGAGAAALAAPGALLLLTALLSSTRGAATSWFVAGFFPPGTPDALRWAELRHMATDAAIGGLLALTAATGALLVHRGRVRPALLSVLLPAVVAADLLRTGAGLNPTVSAAFWRPSPEVAALAATLRDGSRTYVCEPQASAAYWHGRAEHASAHEVWTFAVALDTLTPSTNMGHHVPTAQSEDMTSLVPAAAAPAEGEGCHDFARLVPRLREAGVGHVLSLDALSDPDLLPRALIQPARIRPAQIHAYDLRDPAPVVELRSSGSSRPLTVDESPGHLTVQLPEPATGLVVVRQNVAPGWTARVDGRTTALSAVDGRYLGVEVHGGARTLHLDYEVPGLRAALVAALAGTLAVAWLARPRLTVSSGSRRAGAGGQPGS
jgi:hypothetical protein